MVDTRDMLDMQGALSDPALRRFLSRLAGRLHWVNVTGLEHVPPYGPVIVATNHSGVRGGLVFESLLKRDIVFTSSIRFFRFPLIRELARRIAVLYVSQADMMDTRLLDATTNIIEGGSMLGIMVQGRQMTQEEGPPKRGAVYLSYRLKARILPVQIKLRGPYARIDIGEPMPPPAALTTTAMQQTMDELCDRIGLGTPDNESAGVMS